MIYTWKCNDCGELNEVNRDVEDYRVPPKECTKCKGKEFTRKITVTPTMFEDAYDKGVFEKIWRHPNL